MDLRNVSRTKATILKGINSLLCILTIFSRKFTSAHKTYLHKCEYMPMLNITDAQGLFTGQIINLGKFIVMYLIIVRLPML